MAEIAAAGRFAVIACSRLFGALYIGMRHGLLVARCASLSPGSKHLFFREEFHRATRYI
jgi:hypothetical protein